LAYFIPLRFQLRSFAHLRGCAQDDKLRRGALPALATVLGQVLLQAGDGHGHTIRQLPFFGGREFAEPHEVSHPVARLLELAFEPSMFRAANR